MEEEEEVTGAGRGGDASTGRRRRRPASSVELFGVMDWMVGGVVAAVSRQPHQRGLTPTVFRAALIGLVVVVVVVEKKRQEEVG